MSAAELLARKRDKVSDPTWREIDRLRSVQSPLHILNRQWFRDLDPPPDIFLARLLMNVYGRSLERRPLQKKEAQDQIGVRDLKTQRRYIALAQQRGLIYTKRATEDKRKQLLFPTDDLIYEAYKEYERLLEEHENVLQTTLSKVAAIVATIKPAPFLNFKGCNLSFADLIMQESSFISEADMNAICQALLHIKFRMRGGGRVANEYYSDFRADLNKQIQDKYGSAVEKLATGVEVITESLINALAGGRPFRIYSDGKVDVLLQDEKKHFASIADMRSNLEQAPKIAEETKIPPQVSDLMKFKK
jgi:hypothetical protein